MSETSPQQSGFDLSSIFGMSGIGDMGAAFNVFSRALKGEQIGADEIPAGLQRQALHMAMTQVGVNPAGENAIEAFLGNETVIGQVREALQADLAANTETPQDTILFKAIDDMSGQELKALLVANPDIASMMTESQDFQDMLLERVSSATVADALTAQEIPLDGLNQDLLGKNMSELNVTDLQNLSPSELDILVPALPQDVFNANFLDNINGQLGEDQQVAAPTENNYAARQQAYETAKDNLLENGPAGFTGLFNSVAGLFGKEGIDLETKFYERISASIDENTVTQLKATTQQQANTQIQDFNFAEMDPEAVRAFFDQNKEMVASQLTDQENWPKIEEAINADLLIRNQQRIMDAMLPEMTEEGLSMFQQVLDNLPPEIRELLTSFIDFAANMLGKIGIDIDGFGSSPEADNAASEPETRPDEDEPGRLATLAGPGQ